MGPSSRTAVLVGASGTPPGVDLDRVAAAISSSASTNPTASQPPRQLGGRIAVAISGAAQNIKSRYGLHQSLNPTPLLRISSMGGAPAPRDESSPPDNRTRTGVREVPIRVEGEHRPVLQEERINTNNTGQTNEHNFGVYHFPDK